MKHPDLLPNEASLPYLQRALKGKYYDTGKLGVWELDQYLRLKDGEFVVVVGHANVGKTHTLNVPDAPSVVQLRKKVAHLLKRERGAFTQAQAH
jgi:ABC-type taurine transport system ATPase subunit